ncbi:MAG TPA: helix-turn-helix domain-containing protein [Methylophilus sp.]
MISELHCDEISLFWEYTSQSLYQQGCLEPDKIAIGIPLSHLSHGLFCGATCDKSALHMFSGCSGFEFISPQQLIIGLIAVSRQALMRHLSADDQYFLNLQCQQARIARIPYAAYMQLVHLMKTTYYALKIQPQLANHPHFRDETTERITQLICASLLNNQQPMEVFRHKSWDVLAMSRALVTQREDNPPTVAELCASLAMSRRSVQYHFEQTLHISPVAFLRAHRLNGVRHMLKTASSVTEAATHWGFWHFGHFSQEYRKMFGELPSITYKRLHRRSSFS